ncbi:MAG: hypothetical protein SOI26_06930, partial [Coriobacteriales bacterium]
RRASWRAAGRCTRRRRATGSATAPPYHRGWHRILVQDGCRTPAEEASQIQNRHWGAREWAVVVVAVTMAGLAVDGVVHGVRKHRRKTAYVPRH